MAVPSTDGSKSLNPGEKVVFSSAGASASFKQYKVIQDEWNSDLSAYEIEVCLKDDGTTEPRVSSERWSLRDDRGGTYGQPYGYTGQPVSPMYPEGKLLKWGDCARGWVTTHVPAGTRMIEARYEAANGELYTWEIGK